MLTHNVSNLTRLTVIDILPRGSVFFQIATLAINISSLVLSVPQTVPRFGHAADARRWAYVGLAKLQLDDHEHGLSQFIVIIFMGHA